MSKLNSLLLFWLFGLPLLIGLLTQSLLIGLVVLLLNPALWLMVYGAIKPPHRAKTDRLLHRYDDD